MQGCRGAGVLSILHVRALAGLHSAALDHHGVNAPDSAAGLRTAASYPLHDAEVSPSDRVSAGRASVIGTVTFPVVVVLAGIA